MSDRYQLIYARLSATYPEILTLEQLAEVLQIVSVEALRTAFNRGNLPVTLRSVGGRQRAFLTDVVTFLATGEPQPQILPIRQKIAKSAKKRGRPTNAERIARREAEGRA